MNAQAALHRLIRSILWVLLLSLLAVAADLLILHVFAGLSLDRKRLYSQTTFPQLPRISIFVVPFQLAVSNFLKSTKEVP